MSEGQSPAKGPTTTNALPAKNITPIDRVLGHLEGVHRSGAGWMARCPHHRDRQASLSIKEGDGDAIHWRRSARI